MKKKKLLQTNMIQIIFQIHHDVLVENNHIQQSRTVRIAEIHKLVHGLTSHHT